MAAKRKIPAKRPAGTRAAGGAPSAAKRARATTPSAKPRDAETFAAERRGPPFPVVGIGASAGGLDAVRQLLRALPADTGMAFVLVQHLDPKHASMLSDILGRDTPLPVSQVRDEMRLEPDHVYVIPPGTNMMMSDGHLRLSPRVAGPGQHRPIDDFLRSLATESRHLAIGVILSGSASDGTLGCEDIKAEGGITFAQDDTAQHDSMPRSAVAAGCVDFVMPPAEIAAELGRIARHPFVGRAESKDGDGSRASTFSRIVDALRSSSGVDFSHYKRNTLYRRITRRMILQRMEKWEDYLRVLQSQPPELDALFQDILINVTSFFRDPAAYEELKATVFPQILRERPRHEPVRIWVLGCSTGEEAYSLAIAFTEFAEGQHEILPAQIFATDLNGAGIDKARAGIYPRSIAQDVSPDRLRRFFTEVDGSYRVAKTIRDMCVFARHDVLGSPPFSHIDLVSCRNLLIYLEAVLQQRVLPVLHYALNPHGFLWLGNSETIGSHRDLFHQVEAKARLYTKLPGPSRAYLSVPLKTSVPAIAATASTGREAVGDRMPEVEAQKELDRVLLGRYAPPSIVIDANGEILQFRGDTGPYLAPAPGRASLNAVKMLRDGLAVAVRGAIHKAQKSGQPVREEGLRVKSNGGFRDVHVEVVPLDTPRTRGWILVMFEEPARHRKLALELPPPRRRGSKESEESDVVQIRRLTQELEATREYLQSVIEQQDAANEELQSANEEVQSANEELQSINEELETSKEEIQSTNEELATVNDELQNRNQELTQTNDDLLNLLAGVQMAIVMVGPDLRIRRFTPTAERMLNLIGSDVGRPFSDIKLPIDVPDMDDLLVQAIETVTVKEMEVRDRHGRWYSMRIRPYRTMDNRIDGALIVLVDVDALKRSEVQSRRQAELLDQAHEPIFIFKLGGAITYWNRGAEAIYGFTKEQAFGRDRHELLHPGESPAPVIAEALAKEGRWSGELSHVTRAGATVVVDSRMVVLDEGDAGRLVIETNSPITERKRMEETLRARADELAAANRHKDEFLAMLAHELRNPLVPLANAVEALKGRRRDLPEIERIRTMMERQTRNMARMLDDLLDVSRITRGAILLRKEVVDLGALVEHFIGSIRAQCEAKQQQLGVSLPREPVLVDADPVRLEQILVNLLQNACKFTPERGKIWLSISVDHRKADPSQATDGSAIIRVRDDGVGIPSSLVPRVFDLFVQGDDVGERGGGLGIGLTMVHRLVAMHGGRVEVHSAGPGRGSEFVARLPLAVGVHRGEGARDEADEASASPAVRRRVMIVDDQPDVAESLALVLEQWGHEVLAVRDGRTALDRLGLFKPDIVVLDLGMPAMDGLQVAGELRAKRLSARPTLIALSGFGDDDRRRSALDAGFDHYLVKPPDFGVFRKLIEDPAARGRASAPEPA